jgi:xanthine/uracil/vitamin C permease (AzgA family)
VLLRWEVLSSLALSISPLLQGGEGLIWGFSGIILAWSSWNRKPWAPAAILLAGIIFTLLSWIKLIFLAERVVLENRWPANLVLTIIGIGTLIGILRLKSTRAYYGKNPVKIT